MKTLRTAMIVAAMLSATDAFAWQYNNGRFGMRLTGYLDGGVIEPDFDSTLFIGDWKGRVQLNYAPASGQTLGLVYSMNAQRFDEHRYLDDLFVLWEVRNLGRIEAGYTESIAAKLGLGLPDVGGLRMNDNPLFYKKISPRGTVISDTTIDSGHHALRVNLASVPTNTGQYGVSVAGVTDEYDYALDAGVKFRMPAGKLKAALSFGASFIDSPDDFEQDIYSAHVTADWRAQGAMGLNLQYNSFIWGTTLRAIYDDDPVGRVSDGIVAGTGVSYDLLQYSISLSYEFSDTAIWHHGVPNYADHTVIASLRYKYSANLAGWMSVGMTTETPFVAAGLRLSF